MKFKSQKIRGGILLEPLVAIVIISAVLTYATFTLNNLLLNKNSYLKFKALLQLEAVMNTNNDFENETFTYATFTIEKTVTPSNLAPTVKTITWQIKEQKSNRILGTVKELKNEF